MKKAIVILSALVLGASATAAEFDPLQYVDMKIGTGGHGHVFMGASVPFGLVQLGPTSIPQDWDWCSGYHDSDNSVIGFSHTHLSGTGIGDLFDITVMPVTGSVTYARGDHSSTATGLWSPADRSTEIGIPGYYSVELPRYNVKAEMTATERVGLHRYTFAPTDSAALVFDLANGGCWDRPTETFARMESPTRISGYRHSRGWADDQRVWFVAEFSRPMTAFSLNGPDDMYARVDFGKADPAEPILVKVGISSVDADGAAANLAAELPGWDFEAVKTEAADKWRRELSSMKVEARDKDVLTNFYTAWFHMMIAPVVFSDVDGRYRGADGKIYSADGFVPYTTLSLWDTYRAALPLMSFALPERYPDIINTMLDIADKQGVLPVWHLWGNETNCMVGNPGIIVVADAVAKRTPGVDPMRAMEALVATAEDPARGGKYRQTMGFIPGDMMHEATAYDMEYAVADGALSLAAASLGLKNHADKYGWRSKSYKHYFDPSIGFMRGRLSDGSFRNPFDPTSSSHRVDDFCEGNAWQYTWLVPHDIEGLQQCFGSREAMLAKLDSLFTVSSDLTGDVPPDISGLVGQYAHGNEPGHHIPYIYAMMGEPAKTADLVRHLLAEMYTVAPDGLCGNEDTGQMSAWYILSALGFYEVEPGSNRYWLGSPIIDKASVKVAGGEFVIEVLNNSDKNRYISRVTLNGEDYTKPYIMHSDIVAGGKMTIEMTSDSKKALK